MYDSDLSSSTRALRPCLRWVHTLKGGMARSRLVAVTLDQQQCDSVPH
jgi:hypothetical protein